jgi:hypothetical protein
VFHLILAEELRKSDSDTLLVWQLIQRINTVFEKLILKQDDHIVRDEGIKNCKTFSIDIDTNYQQIV